MKRRTALQVGASLAMLPLLPRTAAACEGSAPAPAAAKAAGACDRMITKIGQNHGHVFQVPVADVTAGADKTYDLTGSAGHSHSITLTADDFRRLRADEIVRTPSTREGHAHRLLVRCGPAVDPPEAAAVCEVQIGGKDDHELVITAADMAAKTDKAYDIQGVAAHTHAVSLTAADFQKLARGEQVNTNTSAGDGHTHVVYVRYPAKPKA